MDGQPQRIVRHQKDEQGPECADWESCEVKKGLNERIN